MLPCSLFYHNPVLHSTGAQNQFHTKAAYQPEGYNYNTHIYQLDYSPPSLAEYYSVKTPRKAAYGDFQSLDNHFFKKLKQYRMYILAV